MRLDIAAFIMTLLVLTACAKVPYDQAQGGSADALSTALSQENSPGDSEIDPVSGSHDGADNPAPGTIEVGSSDTIGDMPVSSSESQEDSADNDDLPTVSSVPADNGVTTTEDGMIAVNITAGDRVFAAEFYGNPLARTIVEQMPFTLDMSDYARQEKVAGLTFELPAASTESPATIHSGELYLWSGNQFVLFYTTFSSVYSYVPIGYIEDTTDLVSALGSGSVSVTFSAA